MKNTLLTLSIASLFTGCIAATELPTKEKVSPSDLTQVNSFVSGSLNNNKEITLMGGVAGQYSAGNGFLSLVEHKSATTHENNRLAQDTRVRYFQVFDANFMSTEQIGYSVDYMKSWKMDTEAIGSDTLALGVISKYSLTDSLSVYPNVAYVIGKAKGSTGQQSDVKGFQTNLFASYAINDSSYILLQPQFQQVKLSSNTQSTSADVNTFKIKTGFGTSMDEIGKWWLEVSHTYTENNAEIKYVDQKITGINKDHLFDVTVSYYF